MKDKETIRVLMRLLDRGVLNPDEADAVRSAIGVLSWTTLADSRIEMLKKKQQKERK